MGYFTIDNVIKLAVLILILFFIYYLINIGNRFVDKGDALHLSKGKINKYLLILVALILAIFIYRKFSIVRKILTILLASSILAYLLNPLVNYFEGKLKRFKLHRSIPILIVYVIVFGLLIVLLAIIIPGMVKEFAKFILTIPSLINRLDNWMQGFSAVLPENTSAGIMDKLYLEINKLVESARSGLSFQFSDFLLSLRDRLPRILSNLLVMAVTPVVTFYFLLDRKEIKKKMKNYFIERNKRGVLDLAHDLNLAMSSFVKGRIIMAIFTGVTTAAFMFIIQVDFAVVIGIITTIADIIPYIGPFLGFLPAVIMATIQSPFKGLLMAIAFVLIQWVENNIVGPNILSSSVGIHPVVVLLCLILGGSLGGVFGMIFSLPLVVAIKVIYEHIDDDLKSFYRKLTNKE